MGAIEILFLISTLPIFIGSNSLLLFIVVASNAVNRSFFQSLPSKSHIPGLHQRYDKTLFNYNVEKEKDRQHRSPSPFAPDIRLHRSQAGIPENRW